MAARFSHCVRVVAAMAVLTPIAAIPAPANRESARLPTNGKSIRDDRRDVRFVIVGDRTAGHRIGVFETAMRQVDLLKPQFVVSVGDFIEGYVDDEAEIARRWSEVTAATAQLSMPFHYVVGNNDISNPTMGRAWDQLLGRRYYSFVYRDVLFVALDTEDPPPSETEKRRLRESFTIAERQAARSLATLSPEELRRTLAANPRLAEMVRLSTSTEQVNMSAGQLAWVQRQLAAHPRVRHTFFLMHRPGWKYESPAFQEIEGMAKGRPHSFIAGHYHSYEHSRRDGVDYIQMGTTGGAKTNEDGDHVLLVTVQNGQPTIAWIGLEQLKDINARLPTP